MKFLSPLHTTTFQSPIGAMRMAASEQGLAGVWFEGQKHGPEARTVLSWHPAPQHPLLLQTAQQLGEYFAGQRHTFEIALDLSHGTAFQQSVWQALLTIACGQTQSYGDICQAIGKPKAARAVGAAVGRNPVSIIVPCHRVVGGNGAMTGYAGGVDKKIQLLQLEKF